jgi:uncharacterized surface protein with fasciclin (FAS1) repeats
MGYAISSTRTRNNPKAIETLLGQFVTAAPSKTLVDGSLSTTDALISGPNLSASNGVVHVIDNVLVP